MVTQGQITGLCQRIAQTLNPERIILFGSHAQGTATEESDVDLLVVADLALPPSKRSAAVRRLAADIPASFDITVKTPEEFARMRRVPNHIARIAESSGRVLYER